MHVLWMSVLYLATLFWVFFSFEKEINKEERKTEHGDLKCNKITIQSSSEVCVQRFTSAFSYTSAQFVMTPPPIYIFLDVDNVLLRSDLEGACEGALLWARLNYFSFSRLMQPQHFWWLDKPGSVISVFAPHMWKSHQDRLDQQLRRVSRNMWGLD